MRPLLPHEGPRHAGVGTGVSITMEPIGGGSSSWAVASMLPLRKRAIATNTRSRIREDMVLGKYREEGRGVKRGGAASPLVDGTMPSKCSAGCVRSPGGAAQEPRRGERTIRGDKGLHRAERREPPPAWMPVAGTEPPVMEDRRPHSGKAFHAERRLAGKRSLHESRTT